MEDAPRKNVFPHLYRCRFMDSILSFNISIHQSSHSPIPSDLQHNFCYYPNGAVVSSVFLYHLQLMWRFDRSPNLYEYILSHFMIKLYLSLKRVHKHHNIHSHLCWLLPAQSEEKSTVFLPIKVCPLHRELKTLSCEKI